MVVKGFIREAELAESSDNAEAVEMALRVQGVGPGQPRLIIIPFSLLLEMPDLDPDGVKGRSFAAEVEPDAEGRWIVTALTLAARVLRAE